MKENFQGIIAFWTICQPWSRNIMWHVPFRSFLGKIYMCTQSVHIQFDASGQSYMCSVTMWKVRLCYVYIISLLPESSRLAVCALRECSKSSGCAKAWFVLSRTDGDSFAIPLIKFNRGQEIISGRNVNVCCFSWNWDKNSGDWEVTGRD